MSTNNFFKSDLYGIHNIVQASMIVYPKEIILATLRDFFSQDSYYHYSKDQWGFPNTTDHTDLPLGADLPLTAFGSTTIPNTLLSTRLFIGENYRYDGIYYPAILIKNSGSRYNPISINREKGVIKYKPIVYDDGYGNQTVINRPSAMLTAGAWEGQIIIDVITRSLRSRDDLVELIAMVFTDINADALIDVGLVIKPINIGSPSESDDRNDKLFKQSLTLDIRTEWRREIPIENVIDTITFSVSFGNISNNSPISEDLIINSNVSILDTILNI